MPAPLKPLFVDIPDVGTARFYFDINGDQFDAMSAVWGQVDFRKFGDANWDTLDEIPHVGILGGIQNVPQFLYNVARASGLNDCPDPNASSSIGGGKPTVDYFLKKPKGEVDAMILPWKLNVLLPKLGEFLTAMLKPLLGSTSTPTGVYGNVYELLNNQLVVSPIAKSRIENGKIVIYT